MPSAFIRARTPRLIQSRQNAHVKDLRAAFARCRSGDGLIAIEGEHLILEAIASGLDVAEVFVATGSEALLDGLNLPDSAEIYSLPPDIFASAVSTEAPQGIAALVMPPVFSLDQVLAARTTPLVVVSAGLQDPGNLGTLLRSAEAFGATGFVFLPGTVSAYNQKALRASSGSIFRLPAVAAKPEELFAALASHGITTLAAVAADGEPLTHVDLAQPVAIILGNEGNGISDEVQQRAHRSVTIPTPGPVESLNAAVAGSVLLYEAARQRGPGLKDPIH